MNTKTPEQIADLHNRIAALTQEIHAILNIKGNFAPGLIELQNERRNLEITAGIDTDPYTPKRLIKRLSN